MSDLRLQLELELHKLFTWAEAVGLTASKPTLRVNARDAELVPRVLNRLDALLNDLASIVERYPGLKLYETPEEVEELDDEDATLGKLGPKLRDYTRRTSATIFAYRAAPWRRFRWSAFDETQAGNLLHEITKYIAQLEQFLDAPLWDRWRHSLKTDLRFAILSSNDPTTLDIIGRGSSNGPVEQTIHSMTILKQIRLKLEDREGLSGPSSSASWEERTPGSPTSPSARTLRTAQQEAFSSSLSPMRLPIRRLVLSRSARASDSPRIPTLYDGRIVMLEWKRWTSADPKALEDRVNGVAAFLSKLGPFLNSLQCNGYVKDKQFNRYGYIFELPEQCQVASSLDPYRRLSQDMPKIWTLRGLLDCPFAVPPLDQRFKVAASLLETLLNLHTSGWLHKQLHSENVILIRNESPDSSQDVDLSRCLIHVGGYGYARANEPNEMTESLTSETEADLYRHPSSMGPSQVSFLHAFDIFTVGCTLLEIGLWSSFSEILLRHANPGLPNIGILPYRPFQASSIVRASSQVAFDEDGNDEPIGQIGGRQRRRSSLDPKLDLMRLRHELLLSRLPSPEANPRTGGTNSVAPVYQGGCKILQSLAAATGTAYTNLVWRLLKDTTASVQTNGQAEMNEKEQSLQLEIEAVSIIKAIQKTIQFGAIAVRSF